MRLDRTELPSELVPLVAAYYNGRPLPGYNFFKKPTYWFISSYHRCGSRLSEYSESLFLNIVLVSSQYLNIDGYFPAHAGI